MFFWTPQLMDTDKPQFNDFLEKCVHLCMTHHWKGTLPLYPLQVQNTDVPSQSVLWKRWFYLLCTICPYVVIFVVPRWLGDFTGVFHCSCLMRPCSSEALNINLGREIFPYGLNSCQRDEWEPVKCRIFLAIGSIAPIAFTLASRLFLANFLFF